MATRDELMEGAEAEAMENIALSDLEGKEGEITLEDLRTLPGAAELSDDELQSMWAEAQKQGSTGSSEAPAGGQATAEQIAAATGGEAVKTSRGWKVYGEDGKEIGDFSKLTVEQFLKSQIGYNANKAEQRKNLDDLVRVAQFGHFNERKLSQAEAEKAQFYRELQELKPQLAQMAGVNAAVRNALVRFNLGDSEPLQKLIEGVKQHLGNEGVSRPQQQQQQIESTAPDAEGQRVWYEEIQPAAVAVAKQYGALEKEVLAAVTKFIETEPNLTRAKIDAYIGEEIPFLLQQAGYREGGSSRQSTTVTAPESDRVAALEKQLTELRAQMSNGTVETVKSKMRKLPGANRSEAGDGVTVADSETAIPAEALKSAHAFKQFMRGNN